MSNDRTKQLLREVGAELIRQGNHLVYRLPNGGSFTVAKTPRDYRGEINNYQCLRKLLGLSNEGKEARQSERSEKRHKPGIKRNAWSHIEPAPPQASFGRKILEAGYSPPPQKEEAKRAYHRKEKEPVGRCVQYPPEVLKEAVRILEEKGSAAYNEFLKQHREKAVEVIPTRHRKEVTLPTIQPSIEVRVDLARKHVQTLKAANLAADNTIKESEALIVQCTLDKEKNSQLVTRLEQFISAYELVTEEYKSIDTVLTPLEQMQVRQSESKPKQNGAYVRRSSPISYEKLMQCAAPLLSQKNGASVAEIYAFLAPKIVGLEKSHINYCIQAEFTKKDCRLSRIGRAKGVRYTMPSSTLVNGSAAPHAAVA